MDPNACLSELIEALLEGDVDIAVERSRALSNWLACGGFEPDKHLRTALIQALYVYLLTKAQP